MCGREIRGQYFSRDKTFVLTFLLYHLDISVGISTQLIEHFGSVIQIFGLCPRHLGCIVLRTNHCFGT